ncbi:MAG: hypothetical protein A3G99_01280 [Candidatus Zambryskibacteria bacterium RIFCSPLOWO2_12_FULL_39_23]|uniref:DUF397 domain-containing protein n=1 Tax=Candidatus Zambryskibacteria bacterium RIFCSPLOWO2_12_FULL_39_23 TaxID=1802776 RepID=A0A1G2URY6_9BACT|nr:MAG: hypothetical protein A2W51_02055 [Candidatus Zambryskibacteria bacterium RIFCSPHIGHO2_02_39_10]OHB00015.1 MAG: hypothetical protein A3E59_00210 [Candidatus Zambryskibacteria bacterium RIFCSPHIGHO2_12_FULL_39_47]OHB12119.1 MAG: hypothetical protein A3G99_01280 [Candidatus Zambryskibacteria bacterium RIFCSPLOWO2_12_FULL_39_23]
MRTQKKSLFRFSVKDKDFKTASFWSGKHVKCVEVARKSQGVAIRDSKTGNILFFKNREFRAFVKGAKAGQFD